MWPPSPGLTTTTTTSTRNAKNPDLRALTFLFSLPFSFICFLFGLLLFLLFLFLLRRFLLFSVFVSFFAANFSYFFFPISFFCSIIFFTFSFFVGKRPWEKDVLYKMGKSAFTHPHRSFRDFNLQLSRIVHQVPWTTQSTPHHPVSIGSYSVYPIENSPHSTHHHTVIKWTML